MKQLNYNNTDIQNKILIVKLLLKEILSFQTHTKKCCWCKIIATRIPIPLFLIL